MLGPLKVELEQRSSKHGHVSARDRQTWWPTTPIVDRAMQDPVCSTGLVVRGVVKTSSQVNSSGQPHSIISGGVATASSSTMT